MEVTSVRSGVGLSRAFQFMSDQACSGSGHGAT
jgi:hypothetical protein